MTDVDTIKVYGARKRRSRMEKQTLKRNKGRKIRYPGEARNKSQGREGNYRCPKEHLLYEIRLKNLRRHWKKTGRNLGAIRKT